jgi:hypothetical protein
MQSPSHLKFRKLLIVRIDLLSSASFEEASDVLTYQKLQSYLPTIYIYIKASKRLPFGAKLNFYRLSFLCNKTAINIKLRSPNCQNSFLLSSKKKLLKLMLTPLKIC